MSVQPLNNTNSDRGSDVNSSCQLRIDRTNPPQVRNITVGFRYSVSKGEEEEGEGLRSFPKTRLIDSYGLKCIGNLGIIKTDRFTFILSLTSGYTTITGLRHLTQIEEARKEILQILQLPITAISPCVIHNICASGRFSGPLPLSQLRERLKQEAICRVSGNRQYFPALFVKIAPALGTILLFQNGSFSIVGSKSIESIWRIHQIMDVIIQQLS